MSSAIPLDNVAHADLRLRTGHGPRFGDAINQIPVLPVEFAAVQRDCPILFRQGNEGLIPLAILGLEKDQNLFLSAGDWNARYIPALARTAPFRLSATSGNDPAVLVDMDSPRIAAPGEEGAPVFLEHGGQAPALEGALAALRIVHGGAEGMGAMAALFADLGLVEEANISVTRANGQTVKFDGYFAIAPDRLAALDASALGRLNDAGLLGPAYHAAASLENFNTLLALDGTGAG